MLVSGTSNIPQLCPLTTCCDAETKHSKLEKEGRLDQQSQLTDNPAASCTDCTHRGTIHEQTSVPSTCTYFSFSNTSASPELFEQDADDEDTITSYQPRRNGSSQSSLGKNPVSPNGQALSVGSRHIATDTQSLHSCLEYHSADIYQSLTFQNLMKNWKRKA